MSQATVSDSFYHASLGTFLATSLRLGAKPHIFHHASLGMILATGKEIASYNEAVSKGQFNYDREISNCYSNESAIHKAKSL